MKIRYFMVLVGIVWGLSCLGLTLPASAQYLGEAVWTATITERETGPVSPPELVTVKAGITRVGGNYYSVEGQVISTDPLIFSGGGVLIGETLYATCSSSQRESSGTWRFTGVVHIELNRTTLNGSFYEISKGFDTSYRTFSSNRYTAGTLTRTGGIGTLGTSSPGADSLLLEK